MILAASLSKDVAATYVNIKQTEWILKKNIKVSVPAKPICEVNGHYNYFDTCMEERKFIRENYDKVFLINSQTHNHKIDNKNKERVKRAKTDRLEKNVSTMDMKAVKLQRKKSGLARKSQVVNSNFIEFTKMLLDEGVQMNKDRLLTTIPADNTSGTQYSIGVERGDYYRIVYRTVLTYGGSIENKMKPLGLPLKVNNTSHGMFTSAIT
jgi:hypothetical protein